MEYFTFADPHGDFDSLINILNEQGYDPYNPSHQLVGLGDYFGRAMSSLSDCVNIWNYLKSDIHTNKPICIRGNHEGILIDAIHRRTLTYVDICNGEHNTFASFLQDYPSQLKCDPWKQFEAAKIMINCGFLDWLESLPWYYETENYIFTHGFIPRKCWAGKRLPLNDPYFTPNAWNECSWINTPCVIEAFNEANPEGLDKTIVFGHWTTGDLRYKILGEDEFHYGGIFEDKQHKLIGLDFTTVKTNNVGCIKLEEENDK